jgi:hypothetical protein
MNVTDYQRLIKDVKRMENDKGIKARINPKAKKTKKKGKRRI